MTTAKQLNAEWRHHFTPMFVRIASKACIEPRWDFLLGSIREARRYTGAGPLIVDTDAGPCRLQPEDVTVLCWRFWPHLPCDRGNQIADWLNSEAARKVHHG